MPLSANHSKHIVEQVSAAIAQGHWKQAITLLEAENNCNPSPFWEQSLINFRIKGFKGQNTPLPKHPFSHDWDKTASGASGFPEIKACDLNAQAIKDGIMGHGGLIVRGLMDISAVRSMRNKIDKAFLARMADAQGVTSPDTPTWFRRSPEVDAAGPEQFSAKRDAHGKPCFTNNGSLWTADSPRIAAHMVQFYQNHGFRRLLHEYFGEPAMLSVRKWVLRKVMPAPGFQAGWHQDGRFMGDGIETVNLWMTLSDCGGDAKAAGLDIIPSRDRTIFETGTHGAAFNWTVGQGLVDEISPKTPVANPKFKAGDAIFFDHYSLHRTGHALHHTLPRYAVETWFFAASCAPAKQIPLLF
jgi:hypothetical protein